MACPLGFASLAAAQVLGHFAEAALQPPKKRWFTARVLGNPHHPYRPCVEGMERGLRQLFQRPRPLLPVVAASLWPFLDMPGSLVSHVGLQE